MIVAATATPSAILTSAVAPEPSPVTVTRFTSEKVNDPSPGVYPIPGFVIDRVPVALAATPTKSPVASLPAWKNVLPSSYLLSARVVPRPTRI